MPYAGFILCQRRTTAVRSRVDALGQLSAVPGPARVEGTGNTRDAAMRTIRQCCALLVLCLAAACAPAAGEGLSDSPAGSAGQVEVVNDGSKDFVLYMLRDGVRYRLGRVARMETARFSIPAHAAGDRRSYRVQLVAEPGARTRPFSTRPVLWRPGQNLAGRVAGAYPGQNFVLITG
jgi:hypothetical protein